MKTRTPTIGVTACRRELEPHQFHIVGEKYLTAITDGAGGFPLPIPALADSISIDDILSRIDGLLVTGSPSNVEPHHYDGAESEPGTMHDPHRDAVTLSLIPRAIEIGIPVLAVCRGFQETNVAYGGSLHQKVQDVPGYDDHREDKDASLDVRYGPAHHVQFEDGGLLHQITGEKKVLVNSLHSQGIEALGNGLTVEAVADDGLVEAFTIDSAKSFALAVQWHPEWQVVENPVSLAIFRALGQASISNAKDG